jgi:hypothetical protein
MDPSLVEALEALIDPVTRGDPESPLRWTCKSTSYLADELTRQGHPVSARTVAMLLHAEHYSLQANRKTTEGTSHPDRNAQFEYINSLVRRFQGRGQPAVSVDTKKKELIGDFKNAGRTWRPRGQPEAVRVHDFKDAELGKRSRIGFTTCSTIRAGSASGSITTPPKFATKSIRRWWTRMGSRPAIGVGSR